MYVEENKGLMHTTEQQPSRFGRVIHLCPPPLAGATCPRGLSTKHFRSALSLLPLNLLLRLAIRHFSTYGAWRILGFSCLCTG